MFVKHEKISVFSELSVSIALRERRRRGERFGVPTKKKMLLKNACFETFAYADDSRPTPQKYRKQL